MAPHLDPHIATCVPLASLGTNPALPDSNPPRALDNQYLRIRIIGMIKV
jgi:hypothetical protein